MKPSHEQVQSFLDDHFDHPAEAAAPLAEGGWAKAFSFEQDGKDYVIRFGAHLTDFLKDQIAAGFTTDDLPVPPITEVGEAFGGYFAISERAYGEMLDELDGEKMHRIVPAVFKTLDAIREIDVSETDGFGMWDGKRRAPFSTWQDYLLSVSDDSPTRRTHGWRQRLADSPTGDAAFNTAFRRLQELAGRCPDDRHIIHTDLLNKNVLVQDDTMSAVIDWGNALYGDFLHDIACFAYWSSYFPAMDGIDWETEARQHFDDIGLEVPHMEERLRCYKIHIGLDAQAYNAFVQNWDHLAMNAQKTLELAN